VGLQIKSGRRQEQWEMLKALAVLAAAGVFYLCCVEAAAAWIQPMRRPLQITIHFDGPLTVATLPPR
jgi:hypothetical protein